MIADYLETRFRASHSIPKWPSEFAIISAYATTGESWDPGESEVADRRLTAELRALKEWMVRITGYSPSSGHSEPSWAVQLSLEAARMIGLAYRQDAVYYVKEDELSVVRCDNPAECLSVGSFRDRLESQDVATRALLDKLLAESRLYQRGQDYKDLLDFVIRLRNFAPFNAMLLQVQKPGLRFAASREDWARRFSRRPKDGARPLLILWPFAPVALVYDLSDTEGEPVPEDVASCFPAFGRMEQVRIQSFRERIARHNIRWSWIDAGDGRAGLIRIVQRAANEKGPTQYCIHVNENHEPPTQFATIAHELGHLFLGHLGANSKLHIPGRTDLSLAGRELEAESVAYLVCGRSGVLCKSQSYLADFVSSATTVEDLDVYQVMRAAGQVEALLGVTAQSKLHGPRDI